MVLAEMVLHSLGLKLAESLKKLSSAPSVDDALVKTVLKDVSAALLEADVNISLVKGLRDAVTRQTTFPAEDGPSAVNKAKIVEKAVCEELVRLLTPPPVTPGGAPRVAFHPRKGHSNVIMFVGLQGAGKTTTVAKYAHWYATRKWKVAMVCADTFRAGAFDQLKQNATRVRVPFYGSYAEPNPVKIAREGVEQFRRDRYEIIIVDTSGRHKQEAALFAEMEAVAAAVKPDDVVFVMDATIGQAAQGQAKAFKDSVAVGSVIISKLDGHAKGGGALSAVAATGSPITFVGSGEHFDDFQAFDANSFVSKLLGRGDMRGLLADMKDKGVMEDSEKMVRNAAKGKFTFRDLHEQYNSLLKLGPVNKLMEAIPGMGALAGSMPADSNAMFKKFIVMMQSMTPKELDCAVPMDQHRILRVARGAGVHPNEVNMLLEQHKQMGGMMTGMSKAGLMKGGDEGLASKMRRNPNAVKQKLMKNVDPSMLSKIGGLDSMMKLLGAGDGGGDMMAKMKSMAKQMGVNL